MSPRVLEVGGDGEVRFLRLAASRALIKSSPFTHGEDIMRAASAFVLMLIIGLAQVPAQAADSIFRVTLLGSGVPDPQPDRFSASTLIEAGDQKFMIDVGLGATIRLYQLHIPLSKIDVVFFTHYHSDHTIGLPDLLLTGWLPPPFAAQRHFMSSARRAPEPTVWISHCLQRRHRRSRGRA